jgi:hypothetical protein
MDGTSGPRRVTVLAVNVPPELFGKIAPLLARADFEIDRFPSAAGALELVARVPVGVLLVGYPLPDVGMREFLAAVRAPGSPNLQSPLLLLVHEADLAEARELIGRGVNRVVAVEDSPDTLQAAISGLLVVARRSAVRLMVRMVVNLGGGAALELSQSENLSETGMLVHTAAGYPVGCRLGFEFHLPADPLPVRGEGEVVRRAHRGSEPLAGVGIRFLSFERDGLARLQRFLRREQEGAATR